MSEFDLGRVMAALREEESRAVTPPRVEAAVMGAFDTSSQMRVASGPVWRWPVAAAAALLLAVGLGYLGGALRDASLGPASPGPRLLLVGAPILEHESVRIVRMRMPAAVLSRMGLRSTAAPAESIDVDVIVGEDGVARAVRF